MSKLNIGRANDIPNPIPGIVADLVQAGWVKAAQHERWMKYILLRAEAGNRVRTTKACISYLGVNPCEALDRAVTALLDFTQVTGALTDNECRALQFMAEGERCNFGRAA